MDNSAQNWTFVSHLFSSLPLIWANLSIRLCLPVYHILMWKTGGPLFFRLCSQKIANACAVSHYISYSGIVTVLSTVPNTIVRECAEFFWISRFWITCLQSSRGCEILNISTTSTCVLETLRHISFQTAYREVRWRQNCPIGGPLNFFRKMQKKPFFAARQLQRWGKRSE